MIKEINLSKPIENYAEKRGEALFRWAYDTWTGLVDVVLQQLEYDEISDEKFVVICQKVIAVSTLDFEPKELVHLYDHVRGDKRYASLVEWLQGRNLPKLEVREEILRILLNYTTKVARDQPLELFIKAMMLIVKPVDERSENAYRVLTPYSGSRSIHRIGLERGVSDILYQNDIKTLGALQGFVEPPRRGGLILSPRHYPRVTKKVAPFNPLKKLQLIPGIGKETAKKILETLGKWSDSLSPTSHFA